MRKFSIFLISLLSLFGLSNAQTIDSIDIVNITMTSPTTVKFTVRWWGLINPNPGEGGYYRVNFGKITEGVNWNNTISIYMDQVNGESEVSATGLTPNTLYVAKAFCHWPMIKDGPVRQFWTNFTDPCSNFQVTIQCGNSTMTVCQGDSMMLSTNQTGCTYLWSNGATTPIIWVKNSGIYKVTVTKNGCTAMDQVTVTVIPGPQATIYSGQDFGSFGSVDLLAVQVVPEEGNYKYEWNTTSKSPWIPIHNVGTYKVTVTDRTSGCKDVDSYTEEMFSICDSADTVYIQLPCDTTGNTGGSDSPCDASKVIRSHERYQNIHICPGEALTLEAWIPSANQNTVSYHWTGQNIVGVNNKRSVYVQPTQNQTYTLVISRAENDGNCQAVEVFNIITDCQGVTGTGEIPSDKFQVFSGQGSGVINVTSSFEDYELKLYDIAGRELRHQNCSGAKASIPVHDLASGPYILHAIVGDKRMVKLIPVLN